MDKGLCIKIYCFIYLFIILETVKSSLCTQRKSPDVQLTTFPLSPSQNQAFPTANLSVLSLSSPVLLSLLDHMVDAIFSFSTPFPNNPGYVHFLFPLLHQTTCLAFLSDSLHSECFLTHSYKSVFTPGMRTHAMQK